MYASISRGHVGLSFPDSCCCFCCCRCCCHVCGGRFEVVDMGLPVEDVHGRNIYCLLGRAIAVRRCDGRRGCFRRSLTCRTQYYDCSQIIIRRGRPGGDTMRWCLRGWGGGCGVTVKSQNSPYRYEYNCSAVLYSSST